MSEGDEQAGQEGPRHFLCSDCGELIHDHDGEMASGDTCPKCFNGKVVEVYPAQSPEEFTKAMQKPMLDLMERTERERTERSEKQHTQLVSISQRSAAALESIAQSLATIASAVSHDDLGQAAVRIVGDLIGGEGDVPVE